MKVYVREKYENETKRILLFPLINKSVLYLQFLQDETSLKYFFINPVKNDKQIVLLFIVK